MIISAPAATAREEGSGIDRDSTMPSDQATQPPTSASEGSNG